MFKRHTFTCPDVIYLRARQKRNNRIAIGVNLIFIGALWLYGNQAVIEERLDEKENTSV